MKIKLNKITTALLLGGAAIAVSSCVDWKNEDDSAFDVIKRCAGTTCSLQIVPAVDVEKVKSGKKIKEKHEVLATSTLKSVDWNHQSVPGTELVTDNTALTKLDFLPCADVTTGELTVCSDNTNPSGFVFPKENAVDTLQVTIGTEIDGKTQTETKPVPVDTSEQQNLTADSDCENDGSCTLTASLGGNATDDDLLGEDTPATYTWEVVSSESEGNGMPIPAEDGFFVGDDNDGYETFFQFTANASGEWFAKVTFDPNNGNPIKVAYTQLSYVVPATKPEITSNGCTGMACAITVTNSSEYTGATFNVLTADGELIASGISLDGDMLSFEATLDGTHGYVVEAVIGDQKSRDSDSVSIKSGSKATTPILGEPACDGVVCTLPITNWDNSNYNLDDAKVDLPNLLDGATFTQPDADGNITITYPAGTTGGQSVDVTVGTNTIPSAFTSDIATAEVHPGSVATPEVTNNGSTGLATSVIVDNANIYGSDTTFTIKTTDGTEVESGLGMVDGKLNFTGVADTAEYLVEAVNGDKKSAGASVTITPTPSEKSSTPILGEPACDGVVCTLPITNWDSTNYNLDDAKVDLPNLLDGATFTQPDADGNITITYPAGTTGGQSVDVTVGTNTIPSAFTSDIATAEVHPGSVATPEVTNNGSTGLATSVIVDNANIYGSDTTFTIKTTDGTEVESGLGMVDGKLNFTGVADTAEYLVEAVNGDEKSADASVTITPTPSEKSSTPILGEPACDGVVCTLPITNWDSTAYDLDNAKVDLPNLLDGATFTQPDADGNITITYPAGTTGGQSVDVTVGTNTIPSAFTSDIATAEVHPGSVATPEVTNNGSTGLATSVIVDNANIYGSDTTFTIKTTDGTEVESGLGMVDGKLNFTGVADTAEYLVEAVNGDEKSADASVTITPTPSEKSSTPILGEPACDGVVCTLPITNWDSTAYDLDNAKVDLPNLLDGATFTQPDADGNITITYPAGTTGDQSVDVTVGTNTIPSAFTSDIATAEVHPGSVATPEVTNNGSTGLATSVIVDNANIYGSDTTFTIKTTDGTEVESGLGMVDGKLNFTGVADTAEYLVEAVNGDEKSADASVTITPTPSEKSSTPILGEPACDGVVCTLPITNWDSTAYDLDNAKVDLPNLLDGATFTQPDADGNITITYPAGTTGGQSVDVTVGTNTIPSAFTSDIATAEVHPGSVATPEVTNNGSTGLATSVIVDNANIYGSDTTFTIKTTDGTEVESGLGMVDGKLNFTGVADTAEYLVEAVNGDKKSAGASVTITPTPSEKSSTPILGEPVCDGVVCTLPITNWDSTAYDLDNAKVDLPNLLDGATFTQPDADGNITITYPAGTTGDQSVDVTVGTNTIPSAFTSDIATAEVHPGSVATPEVTNNGSTGLATSVIVDNANIYGSDTTFTIKTTDGTEVESGLGMVDGKLNFTGVADTAEYLVEAVNGDEKSADASVTITPTPSEKSSTPILGEPACDGVVCTLPITNWDSTNYNLDDAKVDLPNLLDGATFTQPDADGNITITYPAGTTGGQSVDVTVGTNTIPSAFTSDIATAEVHPGSVATPEVTNNGSTGLATSVIVDNANIYGSDTTFTIKTTDGTEVESGLGMVDGKLNFTGVADTAEYLVEAVNGDEKSADASVTITPTPSEKSSTPILGEPACDGVVCTLPITNWDSTNYNLDDAKVDLPNLLDGATFTQPDADGNITITYPAGTTGDQSVDVTVGTNTLPSAFTSDIATAEVHPGSVATPEVTNNGSTGLATSVIVDNANIYGSDTTFTIKTTDGTEVESGLGMVDGKLNFTGVADTAEYLVEAVNGDEKSADASVTITPTPSEKSSTPILGEPACDGVVCTLPITNWDSTAYDLDNAKVDLPNLLVGATFTQPDADGNITITYPAGTTGGQSVDVTVGTNTIPSAFTSDIATAEVHPGSVVTPEVTNNGSTGLATSVIVDNANIYGSDTTFTIKTTDGTEVESGLGMVDGKLNFTGVADTAEYLVEAVNGDEKSVDASVTITPTPSEKATRPDLILNNCMSGKVCSVNIRNFNRDNYNLSATQFVFESDTLEDTPVTAVPDVNGNVLLHFTEEELVPLSVVAQAKNGEYTSLSDSIIISPISVITPKVMSDGVTGLSGTITIENANVYGSDTTFTIKTTDGTGVVSGLGMVDGKLNFEAIDGVSGYSVEAVNGDEKSGDAAAVLSPIPSEKATTPSLGESSCDGLVCTIPVLNWDSSNYNIDNAKVDLPNLLDGATFTQPNANHDITITFPEGATTAQKVQVVIGTDTLPMTYTSDDSIVLVHPGSVETPEVMSNGVTGLSGTITVENANVYNSNTTFTIKTTGGTEVESGLTLDGDKLNFEAIDGVSGYSVEAVNGDEKSGDAVAVLSPIPSEKASTPILDEASCDNLVCTIPVLNWDSSNYNIDNAKVDLPNLLDGATFTQPDANGNVTITYPVGTTGDQSVEVTVGTNTIPSAFTSEIATEIVQPSSVATPEVTNNGSTGLATSIVVDNANVYNSNTTFTIKTTDGTEVVSGLEMVDGKLNFEAIDSVSSYSFEAVDGDEKSGDAVEVLSPIPSEKATTPSLGESSCDGLVCTIPVLNWDRSAYDIDNAKVDLPNLLDGATFTQPNANHDITITFPEGTATRKKILVVVGTNTIPSEFTSDAAIAEVLPGSVVTPEVTNNGSTGLATSIIVDNANVYGSDTTFTIKTTDGTEVVSGLGMVDGKLNFEAIDSVSGYSVEAVNGDEKSGDAVAILSPSERAKAPIVNPNLDCVGLACSMKIDNYNSDNYNQDNTAFIINGDNIVDSPIKRIPDASGMVAVEFKEYGNESLSIIAETEDGSYSSNAVEETIGVNANPTILKILPSDGPAQYTFNTVVDGGAGSVPDDANGYKWETTDPNAYIDYTNGYDNPIITFGSAGEQDVTLTVTNEKGFTTKKTITVTADEQSIDGAFTVFLNWVNVGSYLQAYETKYRPSRFIPNFSNVSAAEKSQYATDIIVTSPSLINGDCQKILYYTSPSAAQRRGHPKGEIDQLTNPTALTSYVNDGFYDILETTRCSIRPASGTYNVKTSMKIGLITYYSDTTV